MTELLTFTTDIAFLCKLILGNATASPFPLMLKSFGGTVFTPKKYLGERRSPHSVFPLDYSTGDGRYFQIQKSPYPLQCP